VCSVWAIYRSIGSRCCLLLLLLLLWLFVAVVLNLLCACPFPSIFSHTRTVALAFLPYFLFPTRRHYRVCGWVGGWVCGCLFISLRRSACFHKYICLVCLFVGGTAALSSLSLSLFLLFSFSCLMMMRRIRSRFPLSLTHSLTCIQSYFLPHSHPPPLTLSSNQHTLLSFRPSLPPSLPPFLLLHPIHTHMQPPSLSPTAYNRPTFPPSFPPSVTGGQDSSSFFPSSVKPGSHPHHPSVGGGTRAGGRGRGSVGKGLEEEGGNGQRVGAWEGEGAKG